MNTADSRNFQNDLGSSAQRPIAEIYQCVEQLSLTERAALAQHLLNTNELTVIVSNRATVDKAIEQMDNIDLGNMLESIAEQVRRLAS